MMRHFTDKILLTYEDLVYEYFRLTLRRDIRHLLDLFTEDAAIHEPFSEPEDRMLKVNTLIMTTIIMYDLLHNPAAYDCIDCHYNKNRVTCTFPARREIIIRFIFKFGYDNKDRLHLNNKRINFLHIQLIR
jgi:hypothetical protein